MDEGLFKLEISKMVIQKEGVQPKRRTRASRNFVIALSVVSIIGFLNIVTESLFSFSFVNYIESLWLLALAFGLIFETSLRELKLIRLRGLTSEMLGKITMIVVGAIAIVAAILSIPQINIQNATFLAVKGIISILAIIFIVIQTWVSKE